MNAGVSTPRRCCPVIELRQYTLKPAQRDVLIDLFDRHFVESQEAAGMTIVGQFRDRRRPDRFVWIRGFPDMASRHQALERFYGGPVWAAHRTAANATMLDVSDVLLLRPVRSDSGFLLESDQKTPGAAPRNPTTVLAAVYSLAKQADDALVSQFERQVAPRLQDPWGDPQRRIRDAKWRRTRSPGCRFARASTCWYGSEPWSGVSRRSRIHRRATARSPATCLPFSISNPRHVRCLATASTPYARAGTILTSARLVECA